MKNAWIEIKELKDLICQMDDDAKIKIQIEEPCIAKSSCVSYYYALNIAIAGIQIAILCWLVQI